MNVLIIAVLFAFSAMLLAVAFLLPKLQTEKRTGDRLKNIRNDQSVGKSRSSARNKADEAAKRRKNVQETLKEIEEKGKKNKTLSLSLRIEQAGLSITKPTFFMLSGISAIIFMLVGLIMKMPLLVTAGLFLIGGVGFPRFILNTLKKRRIKAFTNELPDAVDIIVRGIKAGLPLNDGMRVVANEAKEPLASEFRGVVEAQQLGIPMADAVQRLYDNIPIPETSFFATVIAIQSSSGGSLSEALGNLSKILRDRKKMKAKVKAISSEAKASAGIIGSLPIIVGSVVYIISPDYMDLLFTTQVGNMVLAAGAIWMTMGTFVMRGMINFDI